MSRDWLKFRARVTCLETGCKLSARVTCLETG